MKCLLLIACLSLFSMRLLAATPDPDAAATVVVFNELDPASIELAGYYADKRGIPYDHLVGLSCPVVESVTREQYDQTIATPLRDKFLARGWWRLARGSTGGAVVESKIRFVALMRGIPLRIGAVAAYPGDEPYTANPTLNHNEAAVDSELAVLGLDTRQISGPLPNPLYKDYFPVREVRDLKYPWLLMVCRLDAAKPATVRRMIDDSLAAERSGLWGFAYVDSRSIYAGGLAQGDEWMRRIAYDMRLHGIPCIHDTAPQQFPEHYPMSRAALYFGWYSSEVEGPFKSKSVRFVPGAIAVHIHSSSAESLREPLQKWCAPLLEIGAAATLGNVYEPYLGLTPHLDLFEDRLRIGFSFAEAAYASQSALSWMTTFVGDPLYRPFKSQQNPMASPSRAGKEYAVYREGAVRWAAKDRAEGEPVLAAKGEELKSGVVLEGLGLLQAEEKDPAAALVSWSRAREFYTDDADRVRCALHTIQLLLETGKKDEALAFTRKQIPRFPKADAVARLQAIVLELDPPPPPPTPVPTPKPEAKADR